MSLEANKTVVCRVTEAENRKDLTILDELIASDYFDQTLQLRGPQGYKQFLSVLFKAFPDWHETIEDLIAEGDKVCVLLTINTGIHAGEFYGIAPTGKHSTHKAIQIWHIVDGKVKAKKSIYDQLDFLKQLGLIVPTEEGKKLFPIEK